MIIKGTADIVCLTCALCATFFCACHTTCRETYLDKVTVSNYTAAADSVLIIKKYVAGSNFSGTADSVVMQNSADGIIYDFAAGFEYRIITVPAGKGHTLKSIEKGNEKGSGGDAPPQDQCHVSISYIVDDSLIKISKSTGLISGGVTLYIRD